MCGIIEVPQWSLQLSLNSHPVEFFLCVRLQSCCMDLQQQPFEPSQCPDSLPPPDWAQSPPSTRTRGQAFYVTSASTKKRFSFCSVLHQFFPFSVCGHVSPMSFVTVLCVLHK